MSEEALRRDLALMAAGEEFFIARMATLRDEDIRQPTGLPGWTRGHVLAHLARNARALGNLLEWARTGVETPMYASPEHRAAAIEEGSDEPARVLRTAVIETSSEFTQMTASMPEQAWTNEVRSAVGRALPATGVPWMRIRESWIHAVDLDSGASFTDLPATVLDRLIDETVARLRNTDGCPSMTIRDTTGGGEWVVGDRDGTVVSGPRASLARWLLGRGVSPDLGDPPTIPKWL
jgi:maleylpyruvate isomerase